MIYDCWVYRLMDDWLENQDIYHARTKNTDYSDAPSSKMNVPGWLDYGQMQEHKRDFSYHYKQG